MKWCEADCDKLATGKWRPTRRGRAEGDGMTFDLTLRPYPAGAGSRVHDELWTLEGHCLNCVLLNLYGNPDFNPEWRVTDVKETVANTGSSGGEKDGTE